MPFPGAPLSPNLQVFPKPEALQTLPFCVFIEASLHRHDWLNPWPLVIDSTSSGPFLPRNQGVGFQVQTLYSQLVPGTTSPHPQVFSKSHFIYINPTVVERGSLWITRHFFHLYDSEVFSGTRTRDQILWQKMLLLFLSLRKFQGFGELGARKCWLR